MQGEATLPGQEHARFANRGMGKFERFISPRYVEGDSFRIGTHERTGNLLVGLAVKERHLEVAPDVLGVLARQHERPIGAW